MYLYVSPNPLAVQCVQLVKLVAWIIMVHATIMLQTIHKRRWQRCCLIRLPRIFIVAVAKFVLVSDC